MRMIVPPIVNRREIDRNLVLFFRQHRASAFRRAISDFCRYYNVKRPAIEWYEYLDWGKTAGKTFEDGRIHLVHPENWKRGRIYNKERMWIAMVYHEMGALPVLDRRRAQGRHVCGQDGARTAPAPAADAAARAVTHAATDDGARGAPRGRHSPAREPFAPAHGLVDSPGDSAVDSPGDSAGPAPPRARESAPRLTLLFVHRSSPAAPLSLA